MSAFVTIFLRQKKFKPKMSVQKKLRTKLLYKNAVKCWWNWHLVFSFVSTWNKKTLKINHYDCLGLVTSDIYALNSVIIWQYLATYFLFVMPKKPRYILVISKSWLVIETVVKNICNIKSSQFCLSKCDDSLLICQLDPNLLLNFFKVLISPTFYNFKYKKGLHLCNNSKGSFVMFDFCTIPLWV